MVGIAAFGYKVKPFEQTLLQLIHGGSFNKAIEKYFVPHFDAIQCGIELKEGVDVQVLREAIKVLYSMSDRISDRWSRSHSTHIREMHDQWECMTLPATPLLFSFYLCLDT